MYQQWIFSDSSEQYWVWILSHRPETLCTKWTATLRDNVKFSCKTFPELYSLSQKTGSTRIALVVRPKQFESYYKQTQCYSHKQRQNCFNVFLCLPIFHLFVCRLPCFPFSLKMPILSELLLRAWMENVFFSPLSHNLFHLYRGMLIYLSWSSRMCFLSIYTMWPNVKQIEWQPFPFSLINN